GVRGSRGHRRRRRELPEWWSKSSWLVASTMSRLRKNQGSYQGIALQLAEKLRFRIWVSLQRYRKFLQIRRPFRGCGLTASLVVDCPLRAPREIERLIPGGFRGAGRGSCAGLPSSLWLDSWERLARPAPRGRKAMRSTAGRPTQPGFPPASACGSRDWKDRPNRSHLREPRNKDSSTPPCC